MQLKRLCQGSLAVALEILSSRIDLQEKCLRYKHTETSNLGLRIHYSS